ncbi:hypothetical protein TcCL_ESM00714 [Trypanosoma cruzi]|nr:hypothetical protein TcCL_ESM00714 [Trypanosoma cruzi]
MHTPGWPQFLASHLSPRMNAARAIGRGQGMLTTKNLNFRHEYAQATGDHQHPCALFNAKLAAQEKRDFVRPLWKSSPRDVQEFREKGDAVVDEGRGLEKPAPPEFTSQPRGGNSPGVQASPCPVGSS